MLYHPRHVQRDDQTPAQLVLIEKRRLDDDAIGTDELFDNPHQQGQQDLAAAAPVVLHLVEHVPRRLKDDALGAKFPRQPLQFDAADLAHIWFAFQHRGHFGHLRRLCGV
ncbi:MAG: hypothetical protein DDT22_00892 [candidate division WS2 bacterium]|nr:hypothetical protein [Candidatus Lithacetigena glycinireducens]